MRILDWLIMGLAFGAFVAVMMIAAMVGAAVKAKKREREGGDEW